MLLPCIWGLLLPTSELKDAERVAPLYMGITLTVRRSRPTECGCSPVYGDYSTGTLPFKTVEPGCSPVYGDYSDDFIKDPREMYELLPCIWGLLFINNTNQKPRFGCSPVYGDYSAKQKRNDRKLGCSPVYGDYSSMMSSVPDNVDSCSPAYGDYSEQLNSMQKLLDCSPVYGDYSKFDQDFSDFPLSCSPVYGDYSLP